MCADIVANHVYFTHIPVEQQIWNSWKEAQSGAYNPDLYPSLSLDQENCIGELSYSLFMKTL